MAARSLSSFPTPSPRAKCRRFFVIGAGGTGELVNYRVSGHHLIVDRLFAAAELRLGDKHSVQKVRIIRSGAKVRR
jgi:type IV secretory pathway VirB9-like protein